MGTRTFSFCEFSISGWQNVMDGIHTAVDQKFERVKINCVIMRGLNDDEIVNFVNLAQDLVQFIQRFHAAILLRQ